MKSIFTPPIDLTFKKLEASNFKRANRVQVLKEVTEKVGEHIFREDHDVSLNWDKPGSRESLSGELQKALRRLSILSRRTSLGPSLGASEIPKVTSMLPGLLPFSTIRGKSSCALSLPSVALAND